MENAGEPGDAATASPESVRVGSKMVVAVGA
jgi:hypothetical protein